MKLGYKIGLGLFILALATGSTGLIWLMMGTLLLIAYAVEGNDNE